jgi:hypothetical protein
VRKWMPEPGTACGGRRLTAGLLAVGLLLAAGALPADGAPLTTTERQHLLAHLEMTESWLADEVSSLSPAQLQFRPAPGAWSIIEILDHLVVAEPIYWQDLQKAVSGPPSRRKGSATDVDMLWYGIDRTHRQKAVTAEEPKGQLRDARTGLGAFRALRSQVLQYARTTEDDLRGHLVAREGSDAYQWMLLISAHAQRHILQIREVKVDPRFPER